MNLLKTGSEWLWKENAKIGYYHDITKPFVDKIKPFVDIFINYKQFFLKILAYVKNSIIFSSRRVLLNEAYCVV